MKMNSLQFGKAMIAALFILLLNVVGVKNALGQNQVAVLQHNDSIFAFYGVNAFQQANNAATDGDIITLSSGDFNSCDITKAITLHGAGMVSDTLGVLQTRINGLFYISISNNTEHLNIEGVYFAGSAYLGLDLNFAKFTRCYFEEFSCYHYYYTSQSHYLYNVAFYNCLINGSNIYSASDSVVFYNCVLNSFLNNSQSSSPTVFAYNSIIIPISYNYYNYSLYLYNCIIGGKVSFIQSQYADHCILIGETFPSTVSAFDCMSVNSYEEVFENWNGAFSIDEDYSLKAQIANSFLGNDGSQVGIFGGAMPFNPRPTYLRPYRCNVSGYTTTDGYLNVDVEVAPEE